MHRGASASPHTKVPLWGRGMAQGPGCLGSPGGCRCLGAPGAWCSMSTGAPCPLVLHIMGAAGPSCSLNPILWLFWVPQGPRFSISPSAPHHGYWGATIPCPHQPHIMHFGVPAIACPHVLPTSWVLPVPESPAPHRDPQHGL